MSREAQLNSNNSFIHKKKQAQKHSFTNLLCYYVMLYLSEKLMHVKDHVQFAVKMFLVTIIPKNLCHYSIMHSYIAAHINARKILYIFGFWLFQIIYRAFYITYYDLCACSLFSRLAACIT